MPEPFYWRNTRDNLLTPIAIQRFQILAKHEGEDFDEAKKAIDEEYARIKGSGFKRHGGKIQTTVNVYREAGWVDLSPNEAGKKTIRITPAGRQALLILSKLPDFLTAVPAFVLGLLSRYQLNNPARPSSRNPAYDAQLKDADVFPYWTLFRVMRACDNFVTSDELRRFVFQIKRSDQIEETIKAIQKYRRDKESGSSRTELDKKYPKPLEGAVSETKYLMPRLGTHVGKWPAVVEKDAKDRWVLNEAYVPFVDEILKNEPIFKDYLDEHSWMEEFGRAVELPGPDEEPESEKLALEDLTLPDDDAVWLKAKSLLDSGSLMIILTGPPGTSKTWYARRIAYKIAGSIERLKLLQFHPSFSYDDFVEGYVPVSPQTGYSESALFEIVPKIFTRLCYQAQASGEKFVLVIDEINRGDISRIFGELLTYLEPDYRGKPFVLAYSGRPTTIPANVLVIGTMNPYDRSITELDDALERRFDRIALVPDANILRSLMQSAGADGSLIDKVVHFFQQANDIASHGFGHTFFKGMRSESDLVRLWNHNLRFVFEKMFRFDAEKYKDLRSAFAAILSDASNLT